MRLRPTLLLLLLAATPLASATVDPGARDLLEFAGTTAGALAAENGRILVGTTDPGDNTPQGPGGTDPGHDEAVWFLLENDGARERDIGPADPTECDNAPLHGFGSGEDCKSPVEAVAIDAAGDRVVVVARSNNGIVLRFDPFSGGHTTLAEAAGAGTPLVDIDRAGETAAVAYQSGALSWSVMVYDWSGDAAKEAWTEAATLPARPTGFDLSSDGEVLTVVADESYFRFSTGSNSPTTDDAFVGTGASVAVASDDQHVSVMGTSAGRLRFHSDATVTDDRLLSFKRQDSPITSTAITENATVVAWGNGAGTLGIGQYAPASNVFQVIFETDVGAEPDHVALSEDGTVVVAVAGDTLHAFGRDGLEAFPLWNATVAGNLGTLSVTDDGETILVPTADGVQLFDAVHALNVTSDAPLLKPGEAGELVLRLRNEGNRLVSTPITIEPQPGWTIEPEADAVVVAPNQTVEVAVAVTPVATTAPGDYELEVQTVGPDGQAVTHDVPLMLEAVVDWAIGLRDDAKDTLSVDAGDPATFSLFIQNNGNTEAKAPIKLKVDEQGWTVSLASGDGKIQAGDTEDLDVVVTPPDDALELDEATITVSLDGFAEPVELRAVVGAVFGVELELPPGITVEAGKSTTFDVTVTNVGNTEDGARVRFGNLLADWTGTFAFGVSETTVKDIAPKESKTVQAPLSVPADASTEAPVIIALSATSFGDTQGSVDDTLLVTVVEAQPEEDPDEESPGLPLVGLLAALGAAVVVGRRRNGT